MAQNKGLAAVILAAGQGKRMKSPLPKVLHTALERPLVSWAVHSARDAGADRIICVVGHGRDAVLEALGNEFGDDIESAVQEEQNGTGHAVQCALPTLGEYDGTVVILYGDCPLIPASLIEKVVEACRQGDGPLAMVTGTLPDPTGYGRIVRNEDGEACAIREHRDCTDQELAIHEVNPGIYAIDAGFLSQSLAGLSANNAQGEIYLTDIVALAADAGGVATVAADMDDLRGVNDRYELALTEQRLRRRRNEEFARAGVTIRDPETVWVGAQATVDAGAILEAQVHLRGRTQISEGARVDVGSVLTDVVVHANAYLKPYTVAAESVIGPSAQIGPFSHLRPGSELGPETRIGNFVETKKTKLGRGSKANHLSYLGDGDIGEGVNIGAGTIFCNYDGVQKHVTRLDDGVFIGSDSQLVAPVTVGEGAYVASGSTITSDVPADALAIARGRQKNMEGYASRMRARFAAEKARNKAESDS